jgi:hypothetical protein
MLLSDDFETPQFPVAANRFRNTHETDFPHKSARSGWHNLHS